MKQWTRMMLVLLGAVSMSACAGDRPPGTDGTPGAAGTAGSTEIAAGDRDFIEDTLADGDAEVELGRLAQERATHADVHAFGAMMVRDHQQAGQKLKTIATKHNMTSPPHADDDHAELRERLSKMSGADFDRAYLNAMVDDHQTTVEKLEDRAEGSNNAEVKQWAAETLPTVKQHLERAKQILQTLGR